MTQILQNVTEIWTYWYFLNFLKPAQGEKDSEINTNTPGVLKMFEI